MKFIIDRTKYIDTKLVDEKEHPTAPLLIYNYTQECQFSKSWDDVTKMCRGLIVNKDTREIVARPFTKFFNYEEHLANGDVLPTEMPKIYPKFDGSLGILYWIDDEPFIATRGSFVSDQALWATKFINKPEVFQWVKNLDRKKTYLFEIIYPENRVVVSYGTREELILLAVIDTETGKSLEVDETNFPFTSEIPMTTFEELKQRDTANSEGFVVHFPKSDMRMKIKFETYVKLHKVMTGLSQIGIWEMLRDGKDPYAQGIPDEMFGWISDVVKSLQERYAEIEDSAWNAYRNIRFWHSRKLQAEVIKGSKYPGVSFAMLDEKDYKGAIWKMIRPKGQSTFRRDIDA